MKITIEATLTPDQADDLVAELVEYAIKVEGVDVTNYWIETDAE